MFSLSLTSSCLSLTFALLPAAMAKRGRVERSLLARGGGEEGGREREQEIKRERESELAYTQLFFDLRPAMFICAFSGSRCEN
jgi:hypothetical protein